MHIHALSVDDYAWPLARVSVVCGKGTYIRSLARDLGAALGVGGMLTGLRRTRVGDFRIEDAVRLDQLVDVLSQEQLRPLPGGVGGTDRT